MDDNIQRSTKKLSIEDTQNTSNSNNTTTTTNHNNNSNTNNNNSLTSLLFLKTLLVKEESTIIGTKIITYLTPNEIRRFLLLVSKSLFNNITHSRKNNNNTNNKNNNLLWKTICYKLWKNTRNIPKQFIHYRGYQWLFQQKIRINSTKKHNDVLLQQQKQQLSSSNNNNAGNEQHKKLLEEKQNSNNDNLVLLISIWRNRTNDNNNNNNKEEVVSFTLMGRSLNQFLEKGELNIMLENPVDLGEFQISKEDEYGGGVIEFNSDNMDFSDWYATVHCLGQIHHSNRRRHRRHSSSSCRSNPMDDNNGNNNQNSKEQQQQQQQQKGNSNNTDDSAFGCFCIHETMNRTWAEYDYYEDPTTQTVNTFNESGLLHDPTKQSNTSSSIIGKNDDNDIPIEVDMGYLEFSSSSSSTTNNDTATTNNNSNHQSQKSFPSGFDYFFSNTKIGKTLLALLRKGDDHHSLYHDQLVQLKVDVTLLCFTKGFTTTTTTQDVSSSSSSSSSIKLVFNELRLEVWKVYQSGSAILFDSNRECKKHDITLRYLFNQLLLLNYYHYRNDDDGGDGANNNSNNTFATTATATTTRDIKSSNDNNCIFTKNEDVETIKTATASLKDTTTETAITTTHGHVTDNTNETAGFLPHHTTTSTVAIPTEVLRQVIQSNSLTPNELGRFLLWVSKSFSDLLGGKEYIWEIICSKQWRNTINIPRSLLLDKSHRGYEWLFRQKIRNCMFLTKATTPTTLLQGEEEETVHDDHNNVNEQQNQKTQLLLQSPPPSTLSFDNLMILISIWNEKGIEVVSLTLYGSSVRNLLETGELNIALTKNPIELGQYYFDEEDIINFDTEQDLDIENWNINVHCIRLDTYDCCSIHNTANRTWLDDCKLYVSDSFSKKKKKIGLFLESNISSYNDHDENQNITDNEEETKNTTCLPTALRNLPSMEMTMGYLEFFSSDDEYGSLQLEGITGKVFEYMINEDHGDGNDDNNDCTKVENIRLDVSLLCVTEGFQHQNASSSSSVKLKFSEIRLNVWKVFNDGTAMIFDSRRESKKHGVTLLHLFDHLRGWDY